MSDVDWLRMKLGDITTKIGSGATPRGGESVYKTSGRPLIRSMNVVYLGFKREGLAFIDDAQANALKGAEVQAGDVLLNITGASIGRVTTAPSDMTGARVNQHVCIIRPTEVLLPKFLSAFLATPEMQSFIADENYGVTRQALTKQQILNIEVPVPPLAEQTRIGDKLGRLLAAVNTCKTRLDAIPATLKRFRQSVLAAATSGELTEQWRVDARLDASAQMLLRDLQARHEEHGTFRRGNAAAPVEEAHDLDESSLPAGWVVASLAELCEPGRPITYGILKPGPELSTGVPYVRVADFPNDKLNLSTIRYTSVEIDKQFARSRLRVGDLLISIRGTVGRLCFIPKQLEGANITQDSARLSIDSRINSYYVALVLGSDAVRSRMARATKGVAVRGINIGDLRVLQIPLPARDEQDEIVRRVKGLFSLADQLTSKLSAANDRVAVLTKSLLSKAFRGELLDSKVQQAAVAANPPAQVSKQMRHFARAVLSAEIVHRLHAEPTFGRIKHKKIFHLCEHIAQLREIEGQYHREAAGPLDNKLIYANVSELKKQQWYEEFSRQKVGHAYRPLSKAGQHRKYAESYWPDKLAEIDQLIELMRTWSTERCEIFSTCYAAWNDLILTGQPVGDDAIVGQILQKWHPAKERISEQRWKAALQWMRERGFVPIGFGRSTVSSKIAPKSDP